MAKQNTSNFDPIEFIFGAWWFWCGAFLLFVLLGYTSDLQKALVNAGAFAGHSEQAMRALASNATAGLGAWCLFHAWRKCSSRWNNWFPLLALLAKGALWASAIVAGWLLMEAIGAGFDIYVFIASAAIFPLFWGGFDVFATREKTRRGAQTGSIARVNSMTKKLDKSEFDNALVLSKLTIPRGAEPYHFMIVGSTGSGKSVAITSLLDQIEARGDIALVVDSGGEFSSRYYRTERDHIINPFDARCAPWSPTAELEGPWDAESLAKSMVPDGTGDSKEWNSYAQTFVTAVLRRLAETQQLSVLHLLYYVQSAPIPVLEQFLEGTAASAQFASEKTFGSIRTIATNYLATYAYLQDNHEPFSVAKFIRKGEAGFLFFTYRDDQLDSLRNMVSCALDIAARTILALPASRDRRVWLIIDEFASIGKVQSIEAVATKARKMGGCLLLGLQSVSQLKDRYGDNTAQTILSCLSSWLILRVSDADTSEYISKYIGEREISRNTAGKSTSDSGVSSSSNQQVSNERAVMPAELQRLKNLEGFFKLAGDYPIADLKLEFPEQRDKISENYAQRDFVQNPMLDLKAFADGLAAAAAKATAAAAAKAAAAAAAQEAPPPVASEPAAVAEHFPALPPRELHPSLRLRGGNHDNPKEKPLVAALAALANGLPRKK